MSQNVKVMVRCRPFAPRQDPKTNVVFIDKDLHQITIQRQKNLAQHQKVFTFDHVFGPDSTQQQIYEQSAFMLVQNVLEGYNGTIFAYGQTGCGKTYTMSGGTSDQTRGVTPRTFRQITTRTASQKDKRHLLHCSYIQIYNEQVYDLFDKKNRAKLQVKEVPGKGTIIKDQKLQIVKTLQQIHKFFQMGSKNRAIRQTSFNKYSSRSHCIFTIYVQSVEQTIDGNQLFKAAKLNLVDLAGSQRQSKLKMAGVGLKETTRINLSLSALGNVISALVDGRSSHIPYRDSKLTRLLQDSLGGNTQTIMIATISPAQPSYQQTLSTLRYASRTKFIKNKPVVNQDPKDTLLRQYAQEIKRLKVILEGINPNLLVDGKVPQKIQLTEQQQSKRLKDQQQKQQLKKKLEALQKLLQKQQVDEDATELQKINRLKQKLKEQQWKQQQYLLDKKKRQEQLMSLQINYKSLNEEVDLLRQRFQELKNKYIQGQQQMKDLRQQSQTEKQELLSTIRTQESELSKYRGIVQIVMNEKQVEQIVNKSKFNQQQMHWSITPFLLKQNILIFPENTSRSFGDLLKKQKQKINMFVSESTRIDYIKPAQRSQTFNRNITQRNTKQSFAFSDHSLKKRTTSLSTIHQPRIKKDSLASKLLPPSQGPKKSLAPVEQKKKLNIDIGKLKMDILAELGKSKLRKEG